MLGPQTMKGLQSSSAELLSSQTFSILNLHRWPEVPKYRNSAFFFVLSNISLLLQILESQSCPAPSLLTCKLHKYACYSPVYIKLLKILNSIRHRASPSPPKSPAQHILPVWHQAFIPILFSHRLHTQLWVVPVCLQYIKQACVKHLTKPKKCIQHSDFWGRQFNKYLVWQ